MPAATARSLLRVSKLESLEHHGLLVVEQGPREVHEALLVDVELHAARLVDVIAFARRIVVELDHVREARAAAALDAEPDRRVRGAALREPLLGIDDRRIGDRDRLLGRWGFGGAPGRGLLLHGHGWLRRALR